MDENRTEKISVNLTPSALERLDAFARAHRWPRSTAAAELIEKGLHADEQSEGED
jgi:metal-responsive CopG/Arc/MetJ family transcriptional regulator